jgi:tripartite-type tricarboxylate transporter receptor subunit TctC
VRKINNEIGRQLKDPTFIKQLLDIGLEVRTNSPEEFSELLRREVPRWRDIVTQAGLKVE